MRIKRKIPSFIFGVSVGLIAGVGFFVFKINDLFYKLKESAREQITVIEQPVKNSDEVKEHKEKSRQKFKIDFGKNQKINYKEVDSLIRTEPQISIATDELLSIKTIKVIKIGNPVSDTDTASAHLANVEENPSDMYFIEFWKTPLNSRGYRFTKNKIMLYGFVDYTNIVLYQLDDSYYIKASNQVYKLFDGGDFKQLERVLDADLLTRIN